MNRFDNANMIFHHGIEGQKWGVKNGPPYPLNGTTKILTAARDIHSAKKRRKNDGSATTMTDDELKKYVARANLEKQYYEIHNSKKTSKADAFFAYALPISAAAISAADLATRICSLVTASV